MHKMKQGPSDDEEFGHLYLPNSAGFGLFISAKFMALLTQGVENILLHRLQKDWSLGCGTKPWYQGFFCPQ